MITAEELLNPISEEKPCGEDLYYDPDFQELESLMKGKEETQFSAAEDPDWGKLHSRCIELYARTKDLRVATAMCLAAVKIDGLPGLKEAMGALKGVLVDQWEAVYPLLDPEDDNDPLYRMNIVAALATPRGTFGDPMRFLDRVCEAPLAESVQLGRFGLADIARAESGEAAEGEDAPPSSSHVDGAFRDSDPADLAAKHQMALDMEAMVGEIDTFITSTVGSGAAPNLELLKAQFTEIAKALAPYVDGAGAGEADAEGGEAGEAAVAGGGGGGVAQGISGEIQSRQDVLKMLDKIIKYYERSEPSSPIPEMLKRTQRFAEMSFMDIILDMCPDAEATVRSVTGEQPPPADDGY